MIRYLQSTSCSSTSTLCLAHPWSISVHPVFEIKLSLNVPSSSTLGDTAPAKTTIALPDLISDPEAISNEDICEEVSRKRGRSRTRRELPPRKWQNHGHTQTPPRANEHFPTSRRSSSRHGLPVQAPRRNSALSPILAHAPSPDARPYDLRSRTPHRRTISKTNSSTRASHHKRAKHRSSISPSPQRQHNPSPTRDTSISPPSLRCLPPPLPPPRLPPPLPPPHIPLPTSPKLSPSLPASPHPNVGHQLCLLPAMNLGLGLRQLRKKPTKRGLADIQWQITMHKSLSWRTSRKIEETIPGPRSTTDANSNQRMISMAALPKPYENDPKRTGSKTHEDVHWTEAHDEELVRRLENSLTAQRLRPFPSFAISRQFPTQSRLDTATPFPSEQPLAPAITLSEPSPRRRLSEPRTPFPPSTSASNCDSEFFTSSCQPSLFTVSPSRGRLSPSPALGLTLPKGILLPAQLAAQAIFRNRQSRMKATRRPRPPGMPARQSWLRDDVTAELIRS